MSEIVVANFVPDPRPSGPLLRVIRVAEALQKRGVDTHLVTSDEADERTRHLAAERQVPLHQIPFPRIRAPKRVSDNVRFLGGSPLDVKGMTRLLKKISADIIHVNGWLTITPILAGKIARTPIIHHLNDMLVPSPLIRGLRPLLNRLVDLFAVASDAVGEFYFSPDVSRERLAPPVDIKYWKSGAVPSDEIRELKKEQGISQSSFVVGTVGNISPNKGHHHLIKAARPVVDRYDDVQFIIVGAPLESKEGYVNQLDKLVKKFNVSGNIIFVGFQEDVREFQAIFDVFALPSQSEACPVALLEAMAMENPVIASNTGGIPEVLANGGGFTVTPGAPKAFADGLIDLLSSPQLRQELGQQGRLQIESEYSLRICADRHLELYEEVM